MIERDEVLRIAALARLELTAEEVERMTRDLSGILEYVAQLTAEEGATLPVDESAGTPCREDRVLASRVTGELLAAAPAREGALVRVPRVVE